LQGLQNNITVGILFIDAWFRGKKMDNFIPHTLFCFPSPLSTRHSVWEIVLSLPMKTRPGVHLSYENWFYFNVNENSFSDEKDHSPSLALLGRPKAIRKWTIPFILLRCFSTFVLRGVLRQ